MNQLDLDLQQIGDNLDLADVDQVKMFSDILAEPKFKGKLEKTCKFTVYLINKWKIKETEYNNNNQLRAKEEQISRLITHLQFFVSFFESLSFKSDIFRFFLGSKNEENCIKLIPQSYFAKQSEILEKFLENEDFKNSKIITKLSSFSLKDIPEKLLQLKILRSETENSNNIDDVKNGFREICALFELTTLLNEYLISKMQNPNILSDFDSHFSQNDTENYLQTIKQKSIEVQQLQSEIEQMKIKLAENQEIIRSFKRNGIEKLQHKLQKSQTKISSLEEERENLLLQIAQNETIKTENTRLQSEISTLNSQCNRLIEGFKLKKKEATKLKKSANHISAKYIQLKEEYSVYQQESEEKISQQNLELNEILLKICQTLSIDPNSDKDPNKILSLIILGINSLKEQIFSLKEKDITKENESNTQKQSILFYRPPSKPRYAQTHAELDKTILDLQNLSAPHYKL